jgi:hypothetical protein
MRWHVPSCCFQGLVVRGGIADRDVFVMIDKTKQASVKKWTEVRRLSMIASTGDQGKRAIITAGGSCGLGVGSGDEVDGE